jgi:hypothetical protein
MSLVTLAEALAFCEVDRGYFEITAANDGLILTSDQGGPSTVNIPDGTYEGAALATALQTAMNADSTLTGGVITFAVSYSTTTHKFTIDATAGHTIAYTNTGSDAGLTLGFSADAAAVQTITSDTEAGDPTAIVEQIRAATEDFVINTHCGKHLEADDYIEYKNGHGTEALMLDEYPVIRVYNVTIGEDNAIEITNSNTDTAFSTFIVTEDELSLIIRGGTNAGTETLSFDTYTTLTLLVDAINALGNGWSAEFMDSDFAPIPSTELIINPGERLVKETSIGYLKIPDYDNVSFKLDADSGILYASGWPKGYNNIRVEYRAGYETLPDDLTTGVLILIKFWYDKHFEESWGVDSYTSGGASKAFQKLPSDAEGFLSRFVKR